MTTPPEAPKRRVLSNEQRRALREALFVRIDRGDISLVEAIKAMRKIAGSRSPSMRGSSGSALAS